MATVPSATTTVSDTAGAVASGTDVCCIIAPVATSADAVPRLYGNAAAVYSQHGYSDGLELANYHAKKAGKSFMFVGIPIVTAGVIGRVDKTGNTNTSVASVVAGGSGVLGEHEGKARVVKGGVVGTAQIVLEISLDNGVSWKTVRLGTGTSYAIPYVGVTLSLAAGSLTAGDTIITWHGSSPRSDATGWASARAALAAQFRGFRSAILPHDLLTSTESNALRAEFDTYASSTKRFAHVRASVKDRLPVATLSHDIVRMTGAPALTFAEVGGTGDTITRASGSWLADGFAVGDVITVTGTSSNNVTGPIASLSATVITLGTTDLAAEVTSLATVIAYPGLTFAEVGATADTITRSRGSWVDDGFRAGDLVTISGTASNNVTTDALASVTATVLTLGSTDLAAEVISAGAVTMTAGQTKAAWMAATDALFESASGYRISLGAGRRRLNSAFSFAGWNFRRPVSWGDSVRAYEGAPGAKLHVATWRKSDGPLDFLDDTDGSEWDDREDVDGGAGSAARFTTFRTWSNGPAGAFITQSLTRGDDGSLLSQTHNVAVVDLACTVVQLNTENVVGRSLVLNDDGTATSDSLKTIESEINAALDLALMQDRGEGPRASKAVWTASTDDILNVPEAVLTGVLDLNLNGTIHSVITTVRVRSGGQ